MPEFKLLLLGDSGVGKTRFVKRLSAELEEKCVATLGAMGSNVVFYTNIGPIRFNVVIPGGGKHARSVQSCHYKKADCAIIMFDVTSRITYKNVPNWHRDVTRVCGPIPIVLLGNKVEIKDRKVKRKQVTFHKKKNLGYYDISQKSNRNIEKPFLWLAKKLVHFVEAPTPQPPLLQLGDATEWMHEVELTAAAATPVPEDGDDDL